MPVQVKVCACSHNEWVEISSQRIESLGYEVVLWCKDCGTVKRTCKPNGSPDERTLDYRQPKLFKPKTDLKVITRMK